MRTTYLFPLKTEPKQTITQRRKLCYGNAISHHRQFALFGYDLVRVIDSIACVQIIAAHYKGFDYIQRTKTSQFQFAVHGIIPVIREEYGYSLVLRVMYDGGGYIIHLAEAATKLRTIHKTAQHCAASVTGRELERVIYGLPDRCAAGFGEYGRDYVYQLGKACHFHAVAVVEQCIQKPAEYKRVP